MAGACHRVSGFLVAFIVVAVFTASAGGAAASLGVGPGSLGPRLAAAGYQSARKVCSAWKGSLGHRANMLDPNMKAIGIGRAYNSASNFDWYWTTTFGGVVDAAPSC